MYDHLNISYYPYGILENKCRCCGKVLTTCIDSESLLADFSKQKNWGNFAPYCSFCKKYTFRDLVSINFYNEKGEIHITKPRHLIKPTIFLDIDGVVCVNKNAKDDYGHLFGNRQTGCLEYIIAWTDADIVICSDWKDNGLEVLQEMWKARNFNGNIVGITPNREDKNRALEVLEYCMQHNLDRYIIIDDMGGYLPFQRPYLVRVDSHAGLTADNARFAIEILNQKKHEG